MGTTHAAECSGPLSAEKRVFVAREVRRIAKGIGCNDVDAGRAVRMAQLELQQTGDRIKAIGAGAQFAVAADLKTKRESVVWPRKSINWLKVGWGVLGFGILAATGHLVYLAFAR